MRTRSELNSILKEILGSDNVYYQPPASVKIKYPAIIYSKNNMDIKRADNTVYTMMNCYSVTVIDRRPDNPVIGNLLSLPYCSYDTQYVSDNLNHDVLTLYY